MGVFFSFFPNGSALISDMLDLSKIEAGKMEEESILFDIREEVDNILSLFEEKFQQKNLEGAALIHDSVPPWLYGDPGRLRQVFFASTFSVPMWSHLSAGQLQHFLFCKRKGSNNVPTEYSCCENWAVACSQDASVVDVPVAYGDIII